MEERSWRDGRNEKEISVPRIQRRGRENKEKRPLSPPLHVVPLYLKSSANTFVFFFDKYLAKEKGERKNIQN